MLSFAACGYFPHPSSSVCRLPEFSRLQEQHGGGGAEAAGLAGDGDPDGAPAGLQHHQH